jgi:catechol 2,3-dioxygenase-like lactoylglutathione lyase family enzyme
MSTIDHVTIRASDRGASERFYDTVLRAIGIEKGHSGEHYAERAISLSRRRLTRSP